MTGNDELLFIAGAFFVCELGQETNKPADSGMCDDCVGARLAAG